MPAELAVIVPCRNVADTLGDQLTALASQEWDGDWEVLVVDNGSTDATGQVAASFAASLPALRIVEATSGRGVAYARNRGALSTDARSVAFCDGDDVVSDGWVAAIGDGLRDHEWVCGVMNAHRLNPAWLARSRGSASDSTLPRFGIVPFARGGNSGIRRSLWERLGGYDESFVGLEDIEFSLRAAAEGHEVVLAPGAEISYRFRSGVGDLWRQGVFYGRGRPELAVRARQLGLPAPSRWAGLRSWGWLVAHLPGLRTREGRRAWLWVAANRVGVLIGSIRARSLYV